MEVLVSGGFPWGYSRLPRRVVDMMAMGWDMGASWCLLSALRSLWDAICRGVFDCHNCDYQTGTAEKKAPNKQILQLCPTYSLVLPK